MPIKTGLNHDPTGIFKRESALGVGSGATTYIALTDTSDASYVGKAGYFPQVNGGETELTLFDLFGTGNTWTVQNTFSGGVVLGAHSLVNSGIELRFGSANQRIIGSAPTLDILADGTNSFITIWSSGSGGVLTLAATANIQMFSSTGIVSVNPNMRLVGAAEVQLRATTQRVYSSAASTLDIDTNTTLNLRTGGVVRATMTSSAISFPGNFAIRAGSGASLGIGSNAATVFECNTDGLGITFGTSNEARFRAAAQRIYSPSADTLNIESGVETIFSIAGFAHASLVAGAIVGLGNFEFSSIGTTTIGGTLGVIISSSTTIGVGGAGIDYVLTFDGENSDCTLKWWEDEAELEITAATGLKITPTSGSGLKIGATQSGVLEAISGVVSAASIGTHASNSEHILACQIFGW